MDNHGDQHSLTGCVFEHFDARALPSAFRATIDLVRQFDVGYVVVGRLALARYSAPRMCDRIELRVEPSPRLGQLMEAVLERVTCRLPRQSTVKIGLMSSTAGTEQYLMEQADDTVCLATEVKMATAEHLLWLALSYPSLTADAEAVGIIQSEKLDLAVFCSLLETKDRRLLHRFKQLRWEAFETKDSTYSSTLKRRLQMRRAC